MAEEIKAKTLYEQANPVADFTIKPRAEGDFAKQVEVEKDVFLLIGKMINGNEEPVTKFGDLEAGIVCPYPCSDAGLEEAASEGCKHLRECSKMAVEVEAVPRGFIEIITLKEKPPTNILDTIVNTPLELEDYEADLGRVVAFVDNAGNQVFQWGEVVVTDVFDQVYKGRYLPPAGGGKNPRIELPDIAAEKYPVKVGG